MISEMFITSAALPFPVGRALCEIKDNDREHRRNFGQIMDCLHFFKSVFKRILGPIRIYSPTRPFKDFHCFKIMKNKLVYVTLQN